MDFRITGLPATPFQPLFSLSDPELAERGARRVVADEHSASLPGQSARCRAGRDGDPAFLRASACFLAL